MYANLRSVFLSAVILLFLAASAHADVKLSGAAYNETSLINQDGSLLYGNRSDLRLKAEGLSEGAKLVAELDFYTLYGYFASMIQGTYGLLPVSAVSELLKDGQFYVDRLYMKFPIHNTDVILGKQRIAWGSGLIFSPTDNFNKPNPLSLSGRREGVNAIVTKTFVGDLSAVDLVIAPADVFESIDGESNLGRLKYSKFASRFTVNKSETDMAFSYQYDGGQQSHIFGLDIKGDLELGYHLETVFIYNNDSFEAGNLADYWQSVFGLDYSFGGKWFLLGEYFYKGSGKGSKVDLPATDFSLLDEFQYKHYLYSQVSYQHDVFWGANISLIWNMVDGSSVLSPNMKYSLFQNTDLNLYCQIFSGDETDEYSPSRLGSDQIYYLSLSVKF